MSEYRKTQMRDLKEKVRSSHCFLTLFDEKMWEDPQPCLELGMAIMLDKPIYVIAPDNAHIPENLRRVSRLVETYKSLEDMKLATIRLMEHAKREGLME